MLSTVVVIKFSQSSPIVNLVHGDLVIVQFPGKDLPYLLRNSKMTDPQPSEHPRPANQPPSLPDYPPLANSSMRVSQQSIEELPAELYRLLSLQLV
jgi:hypothetical protein